MKASLIGLILSFVGMVASAQTITVPASRVRIEADGMIVATNPVLQEAITLLDRAAWAGLSSTNLSDLTASLLQNTNIQSSQVSIDAVAMQVATSTVLQTALLQLDQAASESVVTSISTNQLTLTWNRTTNATTWTVTGASTCAVASVVAGKDRWASLRIKNSGTNTVGWSGINVWVTNGICGSNAPAAVADTTILINWRDTGVWARVADEGSVVGAY